MTKPKRREQLAGRVARLERKINAGALAEIFAGRPDLPADLVKVLGDKPASEVRAIVDSIPRVDETSRKPAGFVEHDGTRMRTRAMSKAESRAYASRRGSR